MFPAFEGVRGVLCLAVLVYHAGIWAGFTWGIERSDHGAGAFVRHFDMAVPVFFVLSAFLLYRPLVLHHLRAARRPDLRSYSLRRLTRLFPAYWLALTVTLFVVGDASEASNWDLARLYLLIQIYWEDTARSGIAQAWSIDTELVFYLLLPLWAMAVRRLAVVRGVAGARATLRFEQVACAGLLIVGLVTRVVAFGRVPTHVHFWFPLNLDMFALGMLLATASAASEARAGDPHEPPSRLRLLADVPAAAIAVVVLCLTILVALDLPIATNETSSQELVKRLITHVVALALVIPAGFGPVGGGGYRRFLSWRPIAWCGTVSYGIYLWHTTIQAELVSRFRPEGHPGPYWSEGALLLIVGGAAISIAVASASWLLLESPLLRRARRPGRGGSGS